MKPVRCLPVDWEVEIEKILYSVGEKTTESDSKKGPASVDGKGSLNVALNGSRKEYSDEEQARNHVVVEALKLGFRLALKERDSLIHQFENLGKNLERDWLTKVQVDGTNLEAMRPDLAGDSENMGSTFEANTHPLIPPPLDTRNMSAASPKLNNRETELNSTRHINNLLGDTSKPIPSPKIQPPFAMSEMLIEPVEEEGEDRSTWEYQQVTIARVPGYGFGIAVSGGRDNPHFKSGDPSIAVSDVLKAGPAWAQLHINDRIICANGVSLENADYTTAVQIMKESDQLNMIIKRRVPMPALEFEQRTLKFTLTKSRRKDDFGVLLGCKFYIRGITNPKLAEKEPGLKEKDVVLKINGQNCEDMTFTEAKKMLEKSKEKLSLVIQRDVPRGATWKWPSQTTLYERLGTNTPAESPRASPMPGNRYSVGEDGTMKLNNAVRTSARYGKMMNSAEASGSPKRFSYGSSHPGSRSRTPSHSLYDDYGTYLASGARTLPPTTPPPRAVTPGEEMVSPGPESPLAQKPPLPGSLPESRRVSFNKESGSVGVRVIGGNEVGIFVSAVQAGSPAAVKGVKPGDKIIKVNTKEMKGVTREEAVLFLLGLQDQVDLVLQYRKDEYDRIRAQNLGDNFYVRTHFDYEKPEEQGELVLKRGDIFQVTDTLFGGTVGAWQAVRVSSPTSSDKSEGSQVKGVIPNAQRAEKLCINDATRLSRSVSTEQKSGTLFRRKMGLGRRAKSLTKGHWDEVVFSHGNVNFPAYERVKLKHPGFLRPVVLFGPLADIARELLLRDFPLRFASPLLDVSSSQIPAVGSGIVRLSAIREVMGKNKHCLLDVTPSSVEKLQYAQYSPIVVFVNVDSRSRLRDLRTKHSKASASKNSKKLMEQSQRIAKHYSHLFTVLATLDATKEDQWFEALRELISHLQDRRVWMSETRPADLMDDDFLFPMANSRYSTYGDSDAESLKGDNSEIGVSHPLPNVSNSTDVSYDDGVVVRGETRQMVNGGYYSDYQRYPGMYGEVGNYSSTVNTNNHAAAFNQFVAANGDIYANREAVAHFATIRRPIPQDRPRVKPKPPARLTNYPPIPPKPRLPPAQSESSDSPKKAPLAEKESEDSSRRSSPESSQTLMSSSDTPTFTPVRPTGSPVLSSGRESEITVEGGGGGEREAARKSPLLHPHSAPLSAPHSAPVTVRSQYNRHISEPGYYDVKQILAEQSEDYDRRSPSPPSTYLPPPVASPYYRRNQNGRLGPVYDSMPSSAVTTGSPMYAAHARPYAPIMVRARPPPPQFSAGVTLMNPAFRDQQPPPRSPGISAYPPPQYHVPTSLRSNPVSRTSSMPAATGQNLRNGRFVAPLPQQQIVAPPKSPVPPPAPAPRSPRLTPQSPKLAPAGDLSRTSPSFLREVQGEILPSSPRKTDMERQEVSLTIREPVMTGKSQNSAPESSPEKQSETEDSSQRRTSAGGKLPGSGRDTTTQSPTYTKPPIAQKPVNLGGSGLDLSRRDQDGGSAFELYQKSEDETKENDQADPEQDEPLEHTVVAHVSGVVGGEGGNLVSPETGVSIHIPPDALPVGSQQEIYFKVCRDTRMAPPLDTDKGETLLSPLVMCGPQGLKFDKPVELRLPHCASGVNSEQWSFALKSASGSEAEWRQVTLADSNTSNQHQGRLDEKFVSVLIDHF